MKRMGDFRCRRRCRTRSFARCRTEARQKLGALRPRTLAQASRVPGVSPNDLQNLVLEIERRRLASADARTYRTASVYFTINSN